MQSAWIRGNQIVEMYNAYIQVPICCKRIQCTTGIRTHRTVLLHGTCSRATVYRNEHVSTMGMFTIS